jgi:hypothetical protein
LKRLGIGLQQTATSFAIILYNFVLFIHLFALPPVTAGGAQSYGLTLDPSPFSQKASKIRDGA